MTRKQMVFIIAVNAVISTLISVAVALLVIQPRWIAPTATQLPAETATQVAAEPTATPESITHVVQSGDTISGLAFKYDVPEADIIAANQLQNPNFLQVGVELIIPVGGFTPAAPTLTPVPTATETPLPFEPPPAETATAAADASATASAPVSPLPSTGELQVEITEVIGAGEVDQEQVVLKNIGGRADMQGWTLADADGNTYSFLNVSLWPGGSVTVHTRIGQDDPPTDFFWNKLVSVWSPGETVTLKDADGNVVATYTVGP
jgi:LysM repeat protein